MTPSEPVLLGVIISQHTINENAVKNPSSHRSEANRRTLSTARTAFIIVSIKVAGMSSSSTMEIPQSSFLAASLSPSWSSFSWRAH
jgi:hypothetical protein